MSLHYSQEGYIYKLMLDFGNFKMLSIISIIATKRIGKQYIISKLRESNNGQKRKKKVRKEGGREEGRKE